MPRNRKTITFSLPPEMAEGVKEVMLQERRTMSELIREALRDHAKKNNFLEVREYVDEAESGRLVLARIR